MKKANTPPVSKSVIVPPVKPVEQIRVTRPAANKDKMVTHLFDKENYKWMALGLVVIAIGFLLMAGGKSSNPNVFQDKDVYSFRRITIAPILIIAGFIIEIFAIMRRPAAKDIA
ncbi:MAG: DUF3098 domain-containing protein [Ginsengibacter sp.]